ncbi:MAG: P27 family phage terminase small subunit [Magnetococcus sp. YQC-5]
MAGRPPVPTAVKELRGTVRPSRKKREEPVPERPLDVIPTAVTSNPRALAWWEQLRDDSPPGMLTSVDAPIFEGLCLSIAFAEEAAIGVQKHGVMVKGKNDLPVENPYLHTFKKMMDTVIRAASATGLTPVSRARISIVGKTAESGPDPWENIVPMRR